MRTLLIPFLMGFMALPALGALSEADKAFFPLQNRLLTNPGAELGKSGWTASGGTFTTTTANKAAGNSAFSWDSNAASQTVTSTAITIPDGLKGRNGVLSCAFKAASGTATHTLTANDGTNNLVTAQTISSSTSLFQRTSVNFIFPTSGTIKAKITSVASDEPTIYWDSCYFDLADGFNLMQVSQASLYGAVKYTGKASCDWSTTSATFATFSADTDCSTVAYSGSAASPGSLIPGLTFPSLPAGEYYVVMAGLFTTGSSTSCDFQFYDGTSYSGAQEIGSSQTAGGLAGRFSYSTTQGSTTFQVRGRRNTGAAGCDIYNADTAQNFEIHVYYFPSGSALAYRSEMSSLTDWTSYSPTLVGFGTGGTAPTSVNLWWRRSGDEMQISGTFVSGASTATAAQIPLPTGYTIDSTKVSSRRIIGELWYHATSGQIWSLAATGGNAYLTVGGATGSTSPGTDQNGNVIASSGVTLSVIAKVPIQGWSNTAPVPVLVGGIRGTQTNDSPSTGYVGEVIESTVTTATAVPGASTAFADTNCSASFTAGDWMIGGAVEEQLNGATLTGQVRASINTGAVNADGDDLFDALPATSTSNSTVTIPAKRFSLASTTTVRLTVAATYSAGTPKYVCRMSGWRIR